MDEQPGLVLSEPQIKLIVSHIRQQLPEEACGLAAGLADRIEQIVPVENILHSPVRFHMSPATLFKAFQRFDDLGLDLLAIFHSHPSGPPYPSATDLAEFAYPGTLVLIASPVTSKVEKQAISPGVIVWDGWQIRAFRLESQDYHEVKLELVR